MTYSLTEVVRQAKPGLRRKVVDLGVIEPSRAQWQPLALAFLRHLRRAQETLLELIPLAVERDQAELTRDAAGDEVAAALALAQRRLAQMPEDEILQWAANLDNWHGRRFVSTVQASTGVDISLFAQHAESQQAISTFQRWASALIRDVTDQVRQRIESAAYAAVVNQTSRRVLAQTIMAAMGVSRARAVRIARDQTLKLSGKLDQMRQEEAGIADYIWVHSRKAHPRLHHVERDGQVFQWINPPSDGHPRTQPNCGCSAKAHLTFDT